MSLEQKIQNDLIIAMKAKDDTKKETLRMVKAIIEKFKIDKGTEEISEESIQSIIQKQVKQRQESYESFTIAGRSDMAAKEKLEMSILEAYLPSQLTDSELEILVKEAIEEVGATSKAEIGKIMKSVMPKIQGRSDGKRVNLMISKLL